MNPSGIAKLVPASTWDEDLRLHFETKVVDKLRVINYCNFTLIICNDSRVRQNLNDVERFIRRTLSVCRLRDTVT
jgi:hypothetical protein